MAKILLALYMHVKVGSSDLRFVETVKPPNRISTSSVSLALSWELGISRIKTVLIYLFHEPPFVYISLAFY